ncbi:MAG TPA: carbohydrate kinase family protein [Bacteroidota bacterium]
MKFLLVGHFCFDVLHPADAPEQEQLGGIYHAAAMLSALAGKADTITPVCGIAREDFAQVSAAFAALPGVSPDALYKLDSPTNRVHLFPGPKGVATVCSRDIAPPVPFDRLRRSLKADAILVNMISGFDITLETLDQVRMAARDDAIPIHFDFHNLTLGVNDRHDRFRRPVEAWRRWAFMVDTVQLNEEEIAGLDERPLSEEQTVGHILTLGVKGVLVTRGARGLTVFTDEHKHVARTDVPAPPLPEGTLSEPEEASRRGAPVIAAGDRFGAAFLFHYLKSRNILTAAGDATRAVTEVHS